jgi:hypothetical protein
MAGVHLLLMEPEDLPVEAEVRVEEVQVTELNVGVLDGVGLLAHRAAVRGEGGCQWWTLRMEQLGRRGV